MTMAMTELGPDEPRSIFEEGGDGVISSLKVNNDGRSKYDQKSYQFLIESRTGMKCRTMFDVIRNGLLSAPRREYAERLLVRGAWHFGAAGNNRLRRIVEMNTRLDLLGTELRRYVRQGSAWVESDRDEDGDEDRRQALCEFLENLAIQDAFNRVPMDLRQTQSRGNPKFFRYYMLHRIRAETQISFDTQEAAGKQPTDYGRIHFMVSEGYAVEMLLLDFPVQIIHAAAAANISLAQDHIERRHVENMIAQVSGEWEAQAKEDLVYPGKDRRKPNRSKGGKPEAQPAEEGFN